MPSSPENAKVQRGLQPLPGRAEPPQEQGRKPRTPWKLLSYWRRPEPGPLYPKALGIPTHTPTSLTSRGAAAWGAGETHQEDGPPPDRPLQAARPRAGLGHFLLQSLPLRCPQEPLGTSLSLGFYLKSLCRHEAALEPPWTFHPSCEPKGNKYIVAEKGTGIRRGCSWPCPASSPACPGPVSLPGCGFGMRVCGAR